MRKMQEETEELENVYKDLLLLSNEFKVMKKNFEPTESIAEGMVLSETMARSKSDAMSQISHDVEMIMDVPDDFADPMDPA